MEHKPVNNEPLELGSGFVWSLSSVALILSVISIAAITVSAMPKPLEVSFSKREAHIDREPLVVEAAAPEAATEIVLEETGVSRSVKPQYVEHYITACVMVRNAMPYFVEWIEFHRMVGVDHFVIYDDKSSDGIQLLKKIYERKGLGDILTFINPIFSYNDTIDIDETRQQYESRHARVMDHCYNLVKRNTILIYFARPDQFVFPIGSYSLKEELDKPHYRDFSVIYVPGVPYGTSGLTGRFGVYTSLSPDTGSFEIRYKSAEQSYKAPADALDTRGLFPLLIEANSRRIPFKAAPDKIQITPAAGCFNADSQFRKLCTLDTSVMFTRAYGCDTHPYPICDSDNPEKPYLVASITKELRANYYFLRSINEYRYPFEDSEISFILGNLDAKYFSAVQDNVIAKKYAAQLRDQIMLLEPYLLEPSHDGM